VFAICLAGHIKSTTDFRYAGLNPQRTMIQPTDRLHLSKTVHLYVSGVCRLVDFNVGERARGKLHPAPPEHFYRPGTAKHCHDRAYRRSTPVYRID